jgi:hypothetical protein
MAATLYMVIEQFRDGAEPVYRRFRERGRMAPEGVTYIGSWIDTAVRRCWQIMQAEDRALLDAWMANWSDLVDFEVHEVITSAEAATRVLRSE